jgi:hypothetical protein
MKSAIFRGKVEESRATTFFKNAQIAGKWKMWKKIAGKWKKDIFSTTILWFLFWVHWFHRFFGCTAVSVASASVHVVDTGKQIIQHFRIQQKQSGFKFAV